MSPTALSAWQIPPDWILKTLHDPHLSFPPFTEEDFERLRDKFSQDPTAVSGGVGILNKTYQTSGGFPGGSVVKNLLPMQETWVQSLRWEDPLEEEMTTYSSILAWVIPRTEEPGWLQSMGSQRVGHNWATEHEYLTQGLQKKAWVTAQASETPLVNRVSADKEQSQCGST